MVFRVVIGVRRCRRSVIRNFDLAGARCVMMEMAEGQAKLKRQREQRQHRQRFCL